MPQGASGVFGTMDAVVHARPAAADYGIVAYDAGLKTLVLREDAPAPDAVLLSGLERRMVPLQADGVASGPFGHDKPSSSLFIPPEFRSVNCYVCTGVVGLLRVSVRDTVVGVPTNIDVNIQGYCGSAGGEPGTPGYGWGSWQWRHNVYFGDGTSTVISSSSGFSRPYTYRRPGNFRVRDGVSCRCNSPFVLALAEDRATVTEERCHRGPVPRYGSIGPGPVLPRLLADEIWGVAFSNYTSSALSCKKICGSATYEIVGKVVPMVNEAYYQTDVWAVDSCSASARIEDNILRTIGHESACEEGLKTFREILLEDWTVVSGEQKCHEDEFFRNERIYHAECLSPESDSLEVAQDQTIFGACQEL